MIGSWDDFWHWSANCGVFYSDFSEKLDDDSLLNLSKVNNFFYESIYCDRRLSKRAFRMRIMKKVEHHLLLEGPSQENIAASELYKTGIIVCKLAASHLHNGEKVDVLLQKALLMIDSLDVQEHKNKLLKRVISLQAKFSLMEALGNARKITNECSLKKSLNMILESISLQQKPDLVKRGLDEVFQIAGKMSSQVLKSRVFLKKAKTEIMLKLKSLDEAAKDVRQMLRQIESVPQKERMIAKIALLYAEDNLSEALRITCRIRNDLELKECSVINILEKRKDSKPEEEVWLVRQMIAESGLKAAAFIAIAKKLKDNDDQKKNEILEEARGFCWSMGDTYKKVQLQCHIIWLDSSLTLEQIGSILEKISEDAKKIGESQDSLRAILEIAGVKNLICQEAAMNMVKDVVAILEEESDQVKKSMIHDLACTHIPSALQIAKGIQDQKLQDEAYSDIAFFQKIVGDEGIGNTVALIQDVRIRDRILRELALEEVEKDLVLAKKQAEKIEDINEQVEVLSKIANRQFSENLEEGQKALAFAVQKAEEQTDLFSQKEALCTILDSVS